MTYTGGHSIPYQLTFDEMMDFLSRNSSNQQLNDYTATCEPIYGIVVHEAYGTLLVWHDESHDCGDVTGLHVVDITNMGIDTKIAQAPYESPDSSFVQNLVTEIKNAVAAAQPTINLAMLAAIVIGGYFLMSEFNRRSA